MGGLKERWNEKKGASQGPAQWITPICTGVAIYPYSYETRVRISNLFVCVNKVAQDGIKILAWIIDSVHANTYYDICQLDVVWA